MLQKIATKNQGSTQCVIEMGVEEEMSEDRGVIEVLKELD